MSKENKNLEDEDRLMALLALTSQELPDCKHTALPQDFGDMDFEAMSPEQQQAYFARLDSDPELFERIVNQSRHVESYTPDVERSTQANQSPWSGLVSLKNKVFIFNRYVYAGLACSILLVVVLLPLTGSKPIARSLSEGYASIVATNVAANRQLAENIVLPWERSQVGLGFAPPGNTTTPQALAFASGLVFGAQELSLPVKLNNEQLAMLSTSGDDYQNYKELGRWNILLWAASFQSDALTHNFWVTQNDVSDQFLQQFHSKVLITSHLEIIRQHLNSLESDKSSQRILLTLREEIELLRDQLAPTTTNAFQ